MLITEEESWSDLHLYFPKMLYEYHKGDSIALHTQI